MRQHRSLTAWAVHAAAQKLDCVGGWVAPRAKRTRTSRAGCPEGRMATRSCQLCRTPLPRNVHPASPRPNATGHVEIAERPSFWNSVLDDPIILPDAVGNCSLPGPSPTSPFLSFALDQALLWVWPSTRRLFGHHRAACPRSGVVERRGLLIGKRNCKSVQSGRGGAWPRTSSCETRTLGVPSAHDNRGLEVMADGLPLLRWTCSFGVCTPLWCMQFRVMETTKRVSSCDHAVDRCGTQQDAAAHGRGETTYLGSRCNSCSCCGRAPLRLP